METYYEKESQTETSLPASILNSYLELRIPLPVDKFLEVLHLSN